MSIKRKFKRNIEIEKLVYIYYLFAVLLSGYIEHFAIWNLLCIICFVILAFFCNGLKLIAKDKYLIVSFSVLFIIFLLCSVRSAENMEFYLANLRSIIYPICVILSFYIIQNRKPRMIITSLTKNILWLNLWLLINLVILNQQVNKNLIFIKSEWLQLNPYYRDHCSGLFGANSTDIIGYFIILVITLNIYNANANIQQRWKKLITYLYSGVISAYSLYLFTKNDGVAQFILLPLALLYQMLIAYGNKSILVKVKKIGKYVGIFLAIAILLCAIQPVREFINDKVIYKIETTLKYRSTTAEISGSNERIAIAAYGLSQGWGWLLGKGIGFLKWQAQDAFGFDHFGISSIGSFVNLTGIWFYLAMCFFYACVWQGISETCIRLHGKYINYCMLFLNVVLMTIYVFVFTEIRTNVCLIFIILILYSSKQNKKSEKHESLLNYKKVN